jgi:hypothetical protein
MRPNANKILAYEVWMNDGCLCGVQIDDVKWYVKNIHRERCIEIRGKELTYLLYTEDKNVEYRTALQFAINHHKGLMHQVELDLKEFNRIGQSTRKGRKKPPDTNRGVEK